MGIPFNLRWVVDAGSHTEIEFNSSGIGGAGKNVPDVGLKGGSCENKKFWKVAPMFRPEDKPVNLHGRENWKPMLKVWICSKLI